MVHLQELSSKAMRSLICLSVLLIASAGAVAEDSPPKEQPAKPVAAAESFDFETFGRLPVWFNGQITTMHRVAENLTFELSGEKDLPPREGEAAEQKPAEGGEQPPEEFKDPVAGKRAGATGTRSLRWLLEVLCGQEGWRGDPLILIEHDRLRRLLVLKEGPLPMRVSARSVQYTKELDARWNRLRDAGGPWSAEDRQVVGLVDRLRTLQTMLAVLRLPDTSTREGAVISLQRDAELRKQPIPLFVPPPREGGAWTTLTEAVVLREFSEKLDAEPNPAIDKLLPVLAAYGAGAPQAFNRAVAAYSEYVAGLKLAPCPWEMSVPDGWTEAGVPPNLGPIAFHDVRAIGKTVALLRRSDGGEQATLRVSVFPAAVTSRENVINSWRMSCGLVPLAAEELESNEIDVAGERGGRGWRVDLESPAGLPAQPIRMLGALFSVSGPAEKESQTWVVTCQGAPELVGENVESFDAFLKSLRVGAAAKNAHWFGLPDGRPAQPGFEPGTTFAAAFIPAGESLFTIRAIIPPREHPRDCLKELRTLLRTIEWVDSADVGAFPFRWEQPTSWNVRVDGDGHCSIRTGTQWSDLRFPVESFAAGEEGIPAIIRQWRGELLLPEWTEEEFDRSLKRYECEDDGTATLITWTIPGLPTDKPDREADAPMRVVSRDEKGNGISFGMIPPEDWERPPSRVFQAAFAIPHRRSYAALVLLGLSGDGGGLKTNIERWRKGLVDNDKEAEPVEVKASKFRLRGVEADRVELIGSGKSRVLFVAIPHGGRTWFVTLHGENAAVESARKEFDAFVESAELHDDR